MSNQNEIELIHAANKECDRLQTKIDKLEKKNRALENYKNQSYRIKNQRHEINNRLKENEKLRELLKECNGCVRCLRAYGVSDCNGSKLNDLLTRINVALGNNKTQANSAGAIKIQESEA